MARRYIILWVLTKLVILTRKHMVFPRSRTKKWGSLYCLLCIHYWRYKCRWGLILKEKCCSFCNNKHFSGNSDKIYGIWTPIFQNWSKITLRKHWPFCPYGIIMVFSIDFDRVLTAESNGGLTFILGLIV